MPNNEQYNPGTISNRNPAINSTLLGQLLRLISEANPGTTSGMSGASSKLGSKLVSNLQSTPVDVLAGLLGLGSTAFASTSPEQPSLTSQTGASQKPQLGAYEKGQDKALQELGQQEVMQAYAQGVPAEHINETSKTKRLLQGLAGVAGNFFEGFQQAQGITPQSIKRKDQEMALEFEKRKAQEVPLSEAKRGEIELTGFQELQKALATKGMEGLSPDQGEKFSALLEGQDATRQISSLMFDDPNKFSGLVMEGKFTPRFFKSEQGKQIEDAIERAVEVKLRAETGASAPPGDIKRAATRYKPRVGDSLETAKTKIRTLDQFFSRGLKVSDPQGIHVSRARADESRVEQANAIMQELRRRGISV